MASTDAAAAPSRSILFDLAIWIAWGAITGLTMRSFESAWVELVAPRFVRIVSRLLELRGPTQEIVVRTSLQLPVWIAAATLGICIGRMTARRWLPLASAAATGLFVVTGLPELLDGATPAPQPNALDSFAIWHLSPLAALILVAFYCRRRVTLPDICARCRYRLVGGSRCPECGI